MLRLVVVLAVVGLAVFSLGGTRSCVREDPEGVIPEAYLQSLDKAKAVEQTLQQEAMDKMAPAEAE